ncbi:hypothetical protein WBG78_30670, partial [Chryseolinea sp. T2]|uniref:hypothetical protein n=1 Tax=Chryseolinea sp. T2 TaxID=3129255 RepID=UPI00307800F2
MHQIPTTPRVGQTITGILLGNGRQGGSDNYRNMTYFEYGVGQMITGIPGSNHYRNGGSNITGIF